MEELNPIIDDLVYLGELTYKDTVRPLFVNRADTMFYARMDGEHWERAWSRVDLQEMLEGWVNSQIPLEWQSVLELRQFTQGMLGLTKVWITRDPCGLMAWSKTPKDDAMRFRFSCKHADWRLPLFLGDRTYFEDTPDVENKLRELINTHNMVREVLLLAPHAEAMANIDFMSEALSLSKQRASK